MTNKAMLPYLKWLVAYFKEEYDVFRNKQPHGLSCCIVYSFIKRRWKRRAVWKCYKSEIAAEWICAAASFICLRYLHWWRLERNQFQSTRVSAYDWWYWNKKGQYGHHKGFITLGERLYYDGALYGAVFSRKKSPLYLPPGWHWYRHRIHRKWYYTLSCDYEWHVCKGYIQKN